MSTHAEAADIQTTLVLSHLPPGSTTETITEVLVSLSRRIIMQPYRGPNDTDFLQKHLAPRFRATLDTKPMAFSAAQYIQNVQMFLRANSTWRQNIVATTATLTDEGRRATVWVTLVTTGLQGSTSEFTSREAVNRLRWRRLPGMRWTCTSCHVVRGPGQTGA
jgi:hypothetical protein